MTEDHDACFAVLREETTRAVLAEAQLKTLQLAFDELKKQLGLQDGEGPDEAVTVQDTLDAVAELTDRIATIADEACGMQPVQSAGASLTAIADQLHKLDVEERQAHAGRRAAEEAWRKCEWALGDMQRERDAARLAHGPACGVREDVHARVVRERDAAQAMLRDLEMRLQDIDMRTAKVR